MMVVMKKNSNDKLLREHIERIKRQVKYMKDEIKEQVALLKSLESKLK